MTGVTGEQSMKSKAATIRDLLEQPGLLLMPCCFDALSAKLIEMAGFSFTFMSGFTVSAARLGLPDTGLISYGEMVAQVLFNGKRGHDG
jgi:2-methylisocitrate lyase-like PEP mutase family enzyme